MRIHSQLIAETGNSSLSVMTIAGEFLCFILEDGFRMKKEPGKTRIPPGVYQVVKRTEGRFFAEYKLKFKHHFALEIADVPGFEFILIHIGNTMEDTRGCLLTGYGVSFNGNFALNQSTAAYLYLHGKVNEALERGETVEIEISREILQKSA